MRFIKSSVLVAVLAVLLFARAGADEPSTPAPPSEPAKPKVRVTISKETTYITEPLRPDGYPDYIEAANRIASKGVTPQNNAVVLIMEALGPEVVEEAIRPEFFRRLGVAMPLPAEGKHFLPSHKFAEMYAPRAADGPRPVPENPLQDLTQHALDCTERLWSVKDYPDVARWLQWNERPLRLAIEAAKRERYYLPLVSKEDSLLTVLLPGVMELRDLCRALTARAMLRVHEREFDKAVEDLMACQRLARLMGRGSTLFERLVGMALNRIGIHALACGTHSGKWPADKLRTLEKQVANLPEWSVLADLFDTVERVCCLDSACGFARKGTDALRLAGSLFDEQIGFRERSAGWLFWWIVDGDEPLRAVNHWYDRLSEALRKPNVAQRKAAREAFDAQMEQLIADFKARTRFKDRSTAGEIRRAAGEWVGDMLVCLFVNGLTAVARIDDECQTRDALLRVAVAIEIYRAEHGRYPATLDDVAPRLAPALLDDPYGNGRFRYRRDGAGYWLYSVGRNGRDDGGRNRSDVDADDDTSADIDDLAIRMPPPEPRKR